MHEFEQWIFLVIGFHDLDACCGECYYLGHDDEAGLDKEVEDVWFQADKFLKTREQS